MSKKKEHTPAYEHSHDPCTYNLKCSRCRLDAAAPDMRDALVSLLSLYEYGHITYPSGDHTLVAPRIRQARAALDKAHGQ